MWSEIGLWVSSEPAAHTTRTHLVGGLGVKGAVMRVGVVGVALHQLDDTPELGIGRLVQNTCQR